jgi:hypothetical protein
VVALGHGCEAALTRWCTQVPAHELAEAAASTRAPAGRGGKLHMAVQLVRHMNGRPHVALVKAFRDALTWQALMRPGVTEDTLCAGFPLMPPISVRSALHALVVDRVLEELRLPPAALAASPFAPRADVVGDVQEQPPSFVRAYVSAKASPSPFLSI